MNKKDLSILIEDGSVEECQICGGHSAYAWQDVSSELSDSNDIYSRPTKGQGHLIAHIGAASGFEWECGHCGAHHVQRDSAINSECYTHVSDDAYESEDV